MRIGFLGNTNNFPFMLALALRRRGHEILFLVDQKDRLYRPEYKFPELNPIAMDWVEDYSPLRFRHYLLPSTRMSEVLTRLRGCDAVVLNQYGPSLLPRIGRPALVMLTGSDLDFFANPAALRKFCSQTERRGLRARLECVLFRWLATKQRAGIKMAGAISYFPKGVVPAGDQVLKELGVSEHSRIFIPMTDTQSIVPSPPPFNTPPRIVCIARLNWKKPMRPGTTQLDYKGTDVLLYGLQKYVQERATALDIRLFRKGLDIVETEQLVSALGLASYVTWQDEMSQGDILELIRRSDIVIDQLSESIAGSGSVDAMALGRPVIANWRSDVIPIYRFPGLAKCQASTPDELFTQLERLLSSRAEYVQVAEDSRKAAETYLSSDAAALACENLLTAMVANRPACT